MQWRSDDSTADRSSELRNPRHHLNSVQVKELTGGKHEYLNKIKGLSVPTICLLRYVRHRLFSTSLLRCRIAYTHGYPNRQRTKIV
jgi:hypothetical protein